tara:strand:- start:1466 stop:2095 length:630 start_codon:yes stop_codon:yes gene_type:complete
MSNLMKNPRKGRAVDLYALNPNIEAKEVALQLGVTVDAVHTWRRDPNFHVAVYERYMQEFHLEIPAVLMAAIREAKAGNVQAQRLVLEHSGKLVKNINVTIDSPFEKYLKKIDVAEEVEDADFSEVPIIEDLPERVIEKPKARTQSENKQLKEEIKREEYNKKQKLWYNWKKRAKAVGVEPLKAKRPTKGQRTAWEDEIVRRENEEKDI